MPNHRRSMTVRLVPLTSREASEARVGGTVRERLGLVTELSARLWDATRIPRPSYTRAKMPISVRPLLDRSTP